MSLTHIHTFGFSWNLILFIAFESNEGGTKVLQRVQSSTKCPNLHPNLQNTEERHFISPAKPFAQTWIKERERVRTTATMKYPQFRQRWAFQLHNKWPYTRFSQWMKKSCHLIRYYKKENEKNPHEWENNLKRWFKMKTFSLGEWVAF